MKFAIPLSLIIFLVQIASFSQHDLARKTTEETYLEEVVALAKSKEVKKAFEIIDGSESRTMKDHVYLTEIPAPPFSEENRAMAFKELLEEIGADSIWMDRVGNVIALLKGKEGRRTVVLDAHLDTVFPSGTDVRVKFKGDTLMAPGIGDDTRGLAVIITVLRAIKETGIRTRDDIWIVGSVGEEGIGDLRGVKHLFRDEAPAIDSWISIDGSSFNRITYSGLGSNRYKVTIKGPGGHSWGDFGLANPHYALAEAITKFVEDADAFTKSNSGTSYNVGRIGGGTSVNSIPFESWMEVDIRSVHPQTLENLDEIFKRSMRLAMEEMNASSKPGLPLDLEIRLIGKRPSGKIDPSNPLVQRANASISYFGKIPKPSIGSTNANIPISRGIPAVTIGFGGKGDGAHSLNEWWLNDNATESIKMALLLLLAEAGFEK